MSAVTLGWSEGRVLITEDKDFGEWVYRLKKPVMGIVLIRIPVLAFCCGDQKEGLKRWK